LKKENIKYTLFEKSSIETLVNLYASCDLYIVASRYEGGPQAILEASSMEIPIISTNVGIASSVLSSNCILDIEKDSYFPTKDDINICKINANKLKIESIGKEFIRLFESIL